MFVSSSAEDFSWCSRKDTVNSHEVWCDKSDKSRHRPCCDRKVCRNLPLGESWLGKHTESHLGKIHKLVDEREIFHFFTEFPFSLHTPNPLSQRVSHNSSWSSSEMSKIPWFSSADSERLTGTAPAAQSCPQAGPERFKLVRTKRKFRVQPDVTGKSFEFSHPQRCSQISVQFLTALNSARASSLCNVGMLDDSAACAELRVEKYASTTHWSVGVSACE